MSTSSKTIGLLLVGAGCLIAVGAIFCLLPNVIEGKLEWSGFAMGVAMAFFFVGLPLIALEFPSFRDGRAYSQAYLLRTRLGWQGELRAVGDVLRDQLSHMRQCGFDAFAVREDKSATDALKGLNGISVLYGRSVLEPRPLFRRRGENEEA